MAFFRNRNGSRWQDAAVPMEGSPRDFDPLLSWIGDDCRFVLIGEASHGTHDFYRMRAQITKRLIAEHGFTAVMVEADWPDAYRVNRYVRGTEDDGDAADALAGFKRFPQWMWRNADVLDFVGWLREHNDARRGDSPACGFYGMDLYSLHESMNEVIRYLDRTDPEGARRARERYGCFADFGDDPQHYGYAASLYVDRSCQEQVVQQLVELQRRAAERFTPDGKCPEDEHFFAEQNARLVKNAERYYRSMFEGRTSSWNLRDRHMVETLGALVDHLDCSHGAGKTRVAVWAHNSHLGDARATEMGEGGEVNVGQLVRERWPGQAFNVGFSTYAGSVTAASNWGSPAERKRVRPGLRGSYEALFHDAGIGRFYLDLRDRRDDAELRGPRLQRAIGVIYLPETERQSHYFHARLPEQFDVMIHLDETRFVEPLERTAPFVPEAAETYPTGV
jgi:erythromycin esterase-like protein